jgi:hypothetical protein
MLNNGIAEDNLKTLIAKGETQGVPLDSLDGRVTKLQGL